MAFMRETKKSISVFFIVVGALGLLSGINEISQLSKIAQEGGTLTSVGQAYRVIAYFFMAAAAALLVIGIRFERVVKTSPYLVPAILIVVFVLKFLVAFLVPETLVNASLSVLLLTYLFFQHKRISEELSSG